VENTDIEFNGTRIFLVDVAVDTGTVPNRLLHRLTVTGGRKHASANPGGPQSVIVVSVIALGDPSPRRIWVARLPDVARRSPALFSASGEPKVP
jgi:hypothetical protein